MKRRTFTKFIEESKSFDLIEEGGGAGHLSNVFDIDGFTFDDIKDIIKNSLSGKINLATEKTDGQNIMISWINDELRFARNKGHLRDFGERSMNIGELKSKFAGRGGLTVAWDAMAEDLTTAFRQVNTRDLNDIFDNGRHWMSLEILHPESENLVHYGADFFRLQFHGTREVDESGNTMSEDKQAAIKLEKILKDLHLDRQKTYTITGPHIIELKKSLNFKDQIKDITSNLDKFMDKYNMKNSNTIKDFKENVILKEMPKINDSYVEEGMLQRWLGNGGLQLRELKKRVDADLYNELAMFDKEVPKLLKKHVLELEKIIIKLGSQVLKNVTNFLAVNKDKSKQAIRKRIEDTITMIKDGGDKKHMDKLQLELERLNSAGGLDSIIPSEGIVFFHKGEMLKFTGAFAPANQLFGLRFQME